MVTEKKRIRKHRFQLAGLIARAQATEREEGRRQWGQVRQYHVGAFDSWPLSDRREDEGRVWSTLRMRRTAFRPLHRNPFSRRQVLCAPQ